MVDGRGPLVVLDIVVPEDVLVRRLATRRICAQVRTERRGRLDDGRATKCGGELVARVDDGDDIVRERLKVYQRQTQAARGLLLGRGRRSARSTATSRRTRDRRRSTLRDRGGCGTLEAHSCDRLQVAARRSRRCARANVLVADVLAELAAWWRRA